LNNIKGEPLWVRLSFAYHLSHCPQDTVFSSFICENRQKTGLQYVKLREIYRITVKIRDKLKLLCYNVCKVFFVAPQAEMPDVSGSGSNRFYNYI